MSLRLRLSGLYVLLLAITIAGFALAVYIIASQKIYQTLDDSLDARALVIAGILQPIDGSNAPQRIAEHRRELDNEAVAGGTFQIHGLDGSLIYSSVGPGDRTELSRSNKPPATETISTRKIAGQRLRILTAPITAPDGATVASLQIAGRVSEVDEALDAIRYIFVFSGLAALLITTFLAYVLAGRALVPVRRVSNLALDVERTADFSRRLPASTMRGEMRELTSTFNAMIARVEQTLASQRSFLSDSSHELRRPLTVLRMNLDTLKDPQLSAEERTACLREMSEEAGAMSRLISDLLLLSRDTPQAIAMKPVNYSGLCSTAVNRVRSQDKQHELSADVSPGIHVSGDGERLAQMVENVLENAVQYTPAGGHISLRLHQTNGTAELEIDDTGVGVSADEQAHVFERFYRGERARTLRSEGTGLGLSIVKYVAEAHGGDAWMTARPDRGSRFVVRLPAIE